MPSFRVYEDGRKKPRQFRGLQKKESHVERLLIQNPELLRHKYKVLWFRKNPNTPPDLVGVDRRGRLVVVECKESLGKDEVRKAFRQLEKARHRIRGMTEETIEGDYRKFCRQYPNRRLEEETFSDAFKGYFDEEMPSLKTRNPARYIVSGHQTRDGMAAAMARLKRNKRKVRLVCIRILEKAKTQRGQWLVSVEGP